MRNTRVWLCLIGVAAVGLMQTELYAGSVHINNQTGYPLTVNVIWRYLGWYGCNWGPAPNDNWDGEREVPKDAKDFIITKKDSCTIRLISVEARTQYGYLRKEQKLECGYYNSKIRVSIDPTGYFGSPALKVEKERCWDY